MVFDGSQQVSRFAATFRALSPVEQVVALAYGVVYPNSFTRHKMASSLRNCRFEFVKQRVTLPTYRTAADAPLAAGILLNAGTRRGAQLVAYDDWAPWLTVEAFRQGMLSKIQSAFAYDFNEKWRFDEKNAVMILRNRVVAGQWDQIQNEEILMKSGRLTWLAHPVAAHLLSTLPDTYVDAAYSDCFPELLRRIDSPDSVLNAYASSRAIRVIHAANVAMLHVMRGAFDETLAVFEQLPEDERKTKIARIMHASFCALVAMLRGDDEAAIAKIEEAIRCEKDNSRKRNIFPDCEPFKLALLALVRSHTPARKATLNHLLHVASLHELDSTFLRTIQRACLVRDGDIPSLGPFERDIPGILMDGLFFCWAQTFPSPAGQKQFSKLLSLGAKAADNGYRWLAAECFEVCTRWWRADNRVENEFQVVLARALGTETPSTSDIAAGMHQELGTVPLASAIRPQAEWEHDLERFEQVAYEAKGKARKGKRKSSRKERRLVWLLEIGDRDSVIARPKVQHGYRNGKWSKGQLVSLKRLWEQMTEMDFLTDKDRAVAAKITHGFGYSSYSLIYYLPPSGLYQLAGHRYIFNENEELMELVRREPELLVQEKEKTLQIQVHPHADDADSDGYSVHIVSDTRIELAYFSRENKRLCTAVPVHGIVLPRKAKDRLIEAVSTLAEDIRVQGLIGGKASVATHVTGDPIPWVRLEPSGPGLIATLLVEPVPESGMYFQPGAGGNTTFATVAGSTVQAQRDHAAETKAVRDLTLACPMLSAAGPDLSMAVPDPGNCIELVDQLDAARARCLWPSGQPFRVVGRVDSKSLRLRVKAAKDWFRATGSLQVNEDRVLDLRALFDLMDQNPRSRFVPVEKDAFVSLTSSFQRQLEDLRNLSSASGKEGLRIHGLAALSLKDFFEDAQLTSDDGWGEMRRKFDDARSFEPKVPGTLQAELRPYQVDGYKWLARLGRWGVGACLADDMGLGKTVQALALLLDRAPTGPALVIAPTSVVDNWIDEARRFAPTLNVRRYTGSPRARARHLDDLGPFHMVVTTYGILHIDVDALGAVDWETAVLDEAQAIRNPSTKRARAARKLKAGFRVVTTGTPIQNSLGDLYSLFAFLNPGMLGSQKHFREKFDLPISRDGDPAAGNRLRRLISAFVLRRVKAEVLDDLPPRTEVTLHVELSSEEAALYEALRQRAVEDLEAIGVGRTEREEGVKPEQRRFQVLAHLTRLRLACCNPRLVHPDGPSSSKMQTFAATLAELRKGRHKVLVFSQFVRHLKLIEEHLVEAGIPYQYLDGSTPAKARSQRIAAFQAGEGDVFLISLKAGGVGLNLTAADYVIHMDPWWNPAAEDQASDRAHRIGQTRPVTIYRLVTKDTIEEQIVQLHHSKRELADRLLEGTDTSARLSTKELLKLLRG